MPKRPGGTDATAQGGDNEEPTAEEGSPGRNQVGFPAPVSVDSDFQQRALRDLSRALAILQGVYGALMGPAGVSPPSVCSSQAFLFAELPISNRESPLSGPLLKHLEILAEGSPGAVPAGGAMPKPVAPVDVADAIGHRIFFASADVTAREGAMRHPRPRRPPPGRVG